MSALLDRRLSDEHLGRRLAQGEAPAFDELYRRYAHRLAAYGAHLLGDASAGDDVAQVALMRAYQALREGRVPDAFGAWLYRVAHNAAIDAVRNRRELPAELLPERGGEQRDGEVGALTAAIAALPERQRKVYVLRELHGLRIGETAAELGLSNAQVEQALFAARNRLAEQLVFGKRLSCLAVQRLAAGPLDARERRALETHVRSCASCRKQLGLRGVALSLIPLGWFRSLAVAWKVAGVAAAATLAVAVPLIGRLDPQQGFALPPLAYVAGPDTPLQRVATRPAPKPARRTVARHAPRRRTVAVPIRATPRTPAVHVAPRPVVHSRIVKVKAKRHASEPSSDSSTRGGFPIAIRDGGGQSSSGDTSGDGGSSHDSGSDGGGGSSDGGATATTSGS